MAIYQLKITLLHVKPPVWRRVQVKGEATLGQLHDIIQTAMGWTYSHLHQFVVGKVFYGEPDPEFGHSMQPENQTRIQDIARRPKDSFTYEYDFGDSWLHRILVEAISDPEPGVRYPRCTGGRRNCPPEDVGGVGGYGFFLHVIQDPDHPEHLEYLDWVDGSFDPEAFDPDWVNAQLQPRDG